MLFFVVAQLLNVGVVHGWSEVFELQADVYAWTASKVDGYYAQDSIELAIGELEQAVPSLVNCVEETGTLVAPTPSCVRLVLSESLYASVFLINVTQPAYYTIYADSDPEDFEGGEHYLKDSSGEDVFPLGKEEGHSDDEDTGSARPRAWRLSIFASLLVMACTVIGALIRAPLATAKHAWILESDLFIQGTAALACGALLAVDAYLILAESTHLIMERWSEETQATWRFGTMLISGYATGTFITYFFHQPIRKKDADDASEKDDVAATTTVAVEAKDEERDMTTATGAELVEIEKQGGKVVVPEKEIHYSVVFSIFLGDMIHNFVDGIVIAQAFLECEVSRGWTIAASTIYHELAQEISDFALLMHVGGLDAASALIVNVVSGSSVVLGAVAYMVTKPGVGTQGLMLVYAAGMYMYFGASQAAPQFIFPRDPNAPPKSFKFKFFVFLCFCFGVVAIGLVLIDHEHCGAEDGHDHGHGH